MNPRSAGRRTLGVLTSMLVGTSAIALTMPASHADVLAASPSDATVGFGGFAFGAEARTQGGAVESGPHAYATLNCLTETGKQDATNTAHSDLGKVGNAGATDSSVKTMADGGWKSTVSTTKTAEASLLNGLVKAKGLTATAVARTNGSDFAGTADSQIASLSIAGHPINVDAGANTKLSLDLPGVGNIGSIELNKQFKGWNHGEYKVHTEAIHISILKSNPLGLKVGTDVRLGVANARLTEPQKAFVGGMGFATKVSVGQTVLQSGPTAYGTLPCGGGDTQNRAAEINLGRLAHGGAATTTLHGKIDSNRAESVVTDKIADVNLFGGLITADAITAKASASKNLTPPQSLLAATGSMLTPKSIALSSDGSKLVNLRIKGKPILADDIQPNSKIDVAGLGTVTLRKQVESSNRVKVTMIEIRIGNPKYGKVGTLVEVAHAEAAIK